MSVYAKQVTQGRMREQCCKYEILACQRHLLDLKRQGTDAFPYVFDTTRADRIIRWFGQCIQVRGVDSSSIVAKLLEKGLIEEAGRLDLPGKPIAFQVTDSFLRVFGLGSLADLPPLHGEAGDNEPSEAESDPAIDTAEDGEQLEWK